MGKDGKKLNIVNEKGEIIGEESRERIHKEGLLHREVHVWLYTPKREIIFQHRAKNKDTFPDLLDATAGGHVEINDSYDETAIKEIEEEIGLKIKESDLIYITITKTKGFDKVTRMTNYALRKVFAYRFEEDISNLTIEDGAGLGFEVWSIDTLLTISEEDRVKFIPSILSEQAMGRYKKIDKLI